MSGAGGNRTNFEEQLTNETLMKLQKTFEEADEDGGGGLDMDEFKHAMRKTMGEHLTDEELDLIFMKVDTNCDGTVDWDEYLSYMLLEYTEKDIMNFMVKEKPLPQVCRSVPNMHEYQRRHDSIVKVRCMPNVSKIKGAVYESVDGNSGRYLSITKEGILNSWNMDLTHLATHKITSHIENQPSREQRLNSIWVTDMTVLTNFNMIVVATSASSMLFYEMRVGGGIQQAVQIVDMEIFITATDYWYDPEDPRVGILIWGDGRGNICGLRFSNCFQVCVLHPSTQKKHYSKLKFAELLSTKQCGIEAFRLPNIHGDFVLQVKYCPSLGLFLSCCGDANSSLYLGDVENKRKAYFHASSGTTAFDYCKTNNVIVSGGKDAIVRIWNPYLTRKPVTLLQGHKAAVTNIIINESKEHIISISENNEIIIFDMDTQTCIQQISKKYLRPLGHRTISAVFFHQDRQALILATNQLAIWEHREEELRTQAVTTHTCSNPCILFNSLFKQVVTGSSDSLVCVWDIETGSRIIQFFAYKTVIHGKEEYVAISVMTFDTTLRRLITGARNGCVKIWNFNNGACLNELEVFERMELTGLACFRHRIITAGWNQRLTVYMDTNDEEDLGVSRWPIHHHDEILTLTHSAPSTIASGSYDGDIFIWSLETGYVTMHFNASIGSSNLCGLESRSFQKSLVDEVLHEDKIGQLFGNLGGVGPVYEEDTVKRRGGMTPVMANKMRFQPAEKAQGLPDISIGSKTPHRNRRRVSLLPPQPVQVDPPSIDMHQGATFTPVGNAVEKLLFLEMRKSRMDTATLVSGGSCGWIRFWSIDHKGGLIGQFNAAHVKEESVTSMVTDSENYYLITADSSGYIKVWDIKDFCVEKNKGAGRRREPQSRGSLSNQERLKKFRLVNNNPLLRRKASDQSKHCAPPQSTRPSKTWRVPMILTSFRGHLKSILNICYADEKELIISSSDDCSVRMWTITGLFVGIFGQSEVWGNPTTGPPLRRPQRSILSRKRLLPPDVRRVASATTLKMFYGGFEPMRAIAKSVILFWLTMAKKKGVHIHSQDENTNGETRQEPDADDDLTNILGASYKPLRRHHKLPTIQKPRIFKNQCAVYASLPYYHLEEVNTSTQPPKHVAEALERQQAFSRRWLSEHKGRHRSKQKIIPVRSLSNDAVAYPDSIERPVRRK